MLMVATRVRGTVHDNRKLKKRTTYWGEELSRSCTAGSSSSRIAGSNATSSSSSSSSMSKNGNLRIPSTATASTNSSNNKKATRKTSQASKSTSYHSYYDSHPGRMTLPDLIRASISKLLLKGRSKFDYTPMTPLYPMKKL